MKVYCETMIMECGHIKFNPLFSACDYITGSQFNVVHCENCGFDVTVPQPTPEQMSEYYPAAYYGAPTAARFPLVVEILQRCLYRQRVKWVQRKHDGRNGRVLDVGCGRGLLLKEFQRKRWEVAGTEFSDQAARYAREILELPIQIGTLEKLNFPANYFDAVTLWHVAEHISNPRILFAGINRILKPGGIIMVGVPNFGGWEARFSRDKWFHLDVPRHLTHYTARSLKNSLQAGGFEDFTMHNLAPEYDSFSFVQSVLNRLGLQHNLLYNNIRKSQAQPLGDRKVPSWQFVATWLLAVPLGIISLIFTPVAAMAGHAGTMTVLARKKN